MKASVRLANFALLYVAIFLLPFDYAQGDTKRIFTTIRFIYNGCMVHKPELFKPDWSEHDPDPIYRDYRESKAESRAVLPRRAET